MSATAVERQPPEIAVERHLRGRLATLATDRVLVIGYFTSRSCCAVVGDFSVSWQREAPGPDFLLLPPIEGVPLYADRRLMAVLREGLPELWPGGPFRRDTPTIRLAIPERWIQFLGEPTVVSQGCET